MGLRRRLEGLEEQAVGIKPAPEWTPEELREKVLDELDFALATDSPVSLCREELAALGAGDPSELPEPLRRLVGLAPYAVIAKRYGGPPQKPFVGWREGVRKHRERVRAFEEETRRRDAELIAENRRACGLPPLEGAS